MRARHPSPASALAAGAAVSAALFLLCGTLWSSPAPWAWAAAGGALGAWSARSGRRGRERPRRTRIPAGLALLSAPAPGPSRSGETQVWRQGLILIPVCVAGAALVLALGKDPEWAGAFAAVGALFSLPWARAHGGLAAPPLQGASPAAEGARDALAELLRRAGFPASGDGIVLQPDLPCLIHPDGSCADSAEPVRAYAFPGLRKGRVPRFPKPVCPAKLEALDGGIDLAAVVPLHPHPTPAGLRALSLARRCLARGGRLGALVPLGRRASVRLASHIGRFAGDALSIAADQEGRLELRRDGSGKEVSAGLEKRRRRAFGAALAATGFLEEAAALPDGARPSGDAAAARLIGKILTLYGLRAGPFPIRTGDAGAADARWIVASRI